MIDCEMEMICPAWRDNSDRHMDCRFEWEVELSCTSKGNGKEKELMQPVVTNMRREIFGADN